jgi:hypothetical protein
MTVDVRRGAVADVRKFHIAQIYIPAAFLRLSQSLQYVGQVIPAGTFPPAFAAFQSAAQDRSRACSASCGSAGFFAVVAAVFGAATGAAVVVVAAGFAASVLHFATKSFSVILAASFAALFARHSSWQALTVFCAKEGVVESARPEKVMAQHISSIDRFFMSKLRVPSWVYVASSTSRKALCLLAHGRIASGCSENTRIGGAPRLDRGPISPHGLRPPPWLSEAFPTSRIWSKGRPTRGASPQRRAPGTRVSAPFFCAQ